MLNSTGDDDEFTFFDPFFAVLAIVMIVHAEASLHDQKHLVFIFMMMPRERAYEFDELDELSVQFTGNARVNRWLHIAHLLVAWIVIQLTVGWVAREQGFMLATPAHVGGFIAGLLLQRPLLLWRFRKA